MRLRHFTGRDTAEALRRVKEALGPDAVILQTRAGAEGGVEIIAAVDAELVTPPLRAAEPNAGGRAETDRQLLELVERVRALDRALRPAPPALLVLGAEARALADRLVLQGLPPDLVADIGATFEATRADGAAAGMALEVSLARHLVPSLPAEPRVTAFVGPTGGGKTTTIAKLAARHIAARRVRVGLVMADAARVAAREQLGAYARLLGIPMRVARDGGELRAALAGFADRDAVYIDTSGLAADPGDAAVLERLLADAGERVARTAVVSAGASDRALEAAWRQLAPLAPERCVVTKIDEGASLGTACAWLHARRLALAWLGTGQRVPEDLAMPTGSALVHWLVAA